MIHSGMGSSVKASAGSALMEISPVVQCGATYDEDTPIQVMEI